MTRDWVPLDDLVDAVLAGGLTNAALVAGVLAATVPARGGCARTANVGPAASPGEIMADRILRRPRSAGAVRPERGARCLSAYPRKSRTTSTGWRSLRPESTSWSRMVTTWSSRPMRGLGSSITDDEFVAAGAKILPTADDVWQAADLILKVKEPIAEEYDRMRDGQILFTYLHLAASRECTDALLQQGVTAIAYETVQTPDGALPLLAPMSEVAGRLAPQAGAYHLMRQGGGRGVLMGGVSGVYAAKVVVIGAGVSGHERRGDRTRHAGRGAAAGPQHRAATAGRPDLPGSPPDDRLEQVRGRAGGAGRRPGHRGGAGARRQGADADLERAGLADEAGLGARRHLDRPGRLLRGLPTRPRTRTRPTRCTTRSSTAWRTCPARCRTRRRTR